MPQENAMPEDVELFAAALMREVRDKAIRAARHLNQHQGAHEKGQAWRRAIHELSAPEAVDVVIPAIVDETIFQLLLAIDEDALPLRYGRSDGFFLKSYPEYLAGCSGDWAREFSQYEQLDEHTIEARLGTPRPARKRRWVRAR